MATVAVMITSASSLAVSWLGVGHAFAWVLAEVADAGGGRFAGLALGDQRSEKSR
jgi:hypothetical protein